MPECMPGYPCFMQYLYCVMFVAAMLDDLSLDPWPGLSDEELATYLLKEQWGGPWARHRRCIFCGCWFEETAWLSEGQLLRIREGDHQLLVHGTLIWEKMAPQHVIFPPPRVLLRCRQHRWGAASWDAFAQRGSCGKLRGGSIQPLGEKKEWKKRRWQQKWFILIDFSCKNCCQVIWITGNHLSESEQIFWRFKWLTSWFLRLVEVLKS